MSGILEGLGYTLINLVVSLINLVMFPLYRVLTPLIPNLANISDYVVHFWNNLLPWADFAISFFGFTSTSITLLKTIFVAQITLPVASFGIKSCIRWFVALRG